MASPELTKTLLFEDRLRQEGFIQAGKELSESLKLWKANLQDAGMKQAVITAATKVLASSDALIDKFDREEHEKRSAHAKKSAQVSTNNAEGRDMDDSGDEDEEEDEEADDLERQGRERIHAPGLAVAIEVDDVEPGQGEPRILLKSGSKKRISTWKWLVTMAHKQISVYREARRPFSGLGSYDLLRFLLKHRHRGEIFMLDSPDGYKIDAMLFTPEPLATVPSTATAVGPSKDIDPNLLNSTTTDPPLLGFDRVVLMCNPNAARYEQVALHPFWIEFYRARSFKVCIWNFRGYGRSQGDPSLAALRTDSEALVLHLIQNYNIKHVAVHGESIGGVAACHVASKLPGPDTLLIADRTFASLDAVARALAGTPLARILYAATGWDGDNVTGFLAGATKRNRLILQDPMDEIVRHKASLKVGVSRRIFENSIVCKPQKHAQQRPIYQEEVASLAGEQHPSENSTSPSFSKSLVWDLIDSCEALLMACDRRSYQSSVDAVESSSGIMLHFDPLLNDSSYKILCDFCRIFFHIEAGHGLTFGRALMDDLETRRAQTTFNRSKFGKLAKRLSNACSLSGHCPKRLRGLPTSSQDDSCSFDWFSCTWVYEPSPSMESSNKQWTFLGERGRGPFTLDIALQLMKRCVAGNSSTSMPGIFDYLVCTTNVFEMFAQHKRVDFLQGILVNLDCGHNGAPSKSDLNRVDAFFKSAGWVAAV